MTQYQNAKAKLKDEGDDGKQSIAARGNGAAGDGTTGGVAAIWAIGRYATHSHREGGSFLVAL